MEKNLKKELVINSSAFENGSFLPSKYTCEGQNINPPLEISGIPEEAESLVLMLEDLDAPKGIFDHWLVWNIPPEIKNISENSAPGIQGRNSFGSDQYDGPCPPSGTHRYFFKIFALDTNLNLNSGTKKDALLEAMSGHILTVNEIMGKYQKNLENKGRIIIHA